MTYREIEIAMAKIADSISNNDVKIHKESATFSGSVMLVFLKLRDKEEILENKMERVILQENKNNLIKKAAVIERTAALATYQEELLTYQKVILVYKKDKEKALIIRKELTKTRELKIAEARKIWQYKRDKLSFWKRFFEPTPNFVFDSVPLNLPIKPQLPDTPQSINQYEHILSQEWDFGDLLIYIASHYSFSYIALNFANENTVKFRSLKLLERS